MKSKIKREVENETTIDTKKVKEKGKNCFNILEVVIIMIITIICTATIVIKVSYSINNKKENVVVDTELLELKDTYTSIVKEYYEDIDKDELVASAIEGMIEYLDDPYSTYMDEEESTAFTQELEGEYVGIGTEISLSSNGKVTIINIFDDSPAAKAGLKLKDVIKKVDNNSIEGKTLSEISALIKGKSGTEVNLTVTRDGKDIDLNIIRGKVDLPSVKSKIIESNKKKIGYIDVDVFANNTFEQFEKNIDDLKSKGIESIIIDLRWNTGGYLSTAHSMAELFLNKGDVMYQLDTKGSIKKITSQVEKKYDFNVVVLVNKSTASASEIFTAALKENINAEVVGVTTYGKGKVQKTRTLSNGAMVKYTIQNWLTPSGNEIDGKGIEPTVKVELSDKYYENANEKNDNQLGKALEILSKK